jgi:ABC-2 type transport system permease protein
VTAIDSPAPALPSLGDEARLFGQLRRRLIWANARGWLAHSRLRLLVVAFLCIVFWVALFACFFEGFLLLESAISHAPTRATTVQAVFNVFFVALLAMLTVSSAVIFYSSAFRSDEVNMLLTAPVSTGRLVLYKYQETMLFSCWGFMLLGSPMLIAYGIVMGAPWYYFAMLLPFMVSFVCIPAAIGTLLCILVVDWLPSIRLHAMTLAIVGGAICLALLGWLLMAAQSEDVMTPRWLDQMLGRLRYAEQRVLPSWWLSSGLLEAAHGRENGADLAWRESVLFLSVLISNALLLAGIVGIVGERVFRRAYSRLQGVGAARRKAQGAWIDRIAMWTIAWLPPLMRHLVIKDLRLFRRDPLQWSQFLIFFGLLALYFINIRRFQYGQQLAGWMTMIGFLNLGVVGLILSTFTTRFIFPMISMEGRRFWILGTLPMSRDAVLWSKFLFACGGSLPPCSLLILLSDAMLGIVQTQPLIALVHQIVCWTLCIGLSAVAVGLGARLPNLREPSPSKIAAGFGGTLNLVISAIFIVVVVVSTAIPSYFFLQRRQGMVDPTSVEGFWRWFQLGETGSLVLGVVTAVLVGALVTVLPLRMGFRAFRKLEF